MVPFVSAAVAPGSSAQKALVELDEGVAKGGNDLLGEVNLKARLGVPEGYAVTLAMDYKPSPDPLGATDYYTPRFAPIPRSPPPHPQVC